MSFPSGNNVIQTVSRNGIYFQKRMPDFSFEAALAGDLRDKVPGRALVAKLP